jgi:hypothetical protein
VGYIRQIIITIEDDPGTIQDESRLAAKYPRDFILTKKTKVRNRQTKTLAKGSSLTTGTFKSCRLEPVRLFVAGGTKTNQRQ